MTKNLDLENYHPIASKPRRSNETRRRVAFYFKKSLKYTLHHFEKQIDCTIIKVYFGEKILRNFRIVYTPQSHKRIDFLTHFEDLLHFLRPLKHDTILSGDFNIDIFRESKGKLDYENLITAHCFKLQNSEPTGVTPTSSICLDHLETSFPVKNETIKATFSDHYTVVGEIDKEKRNVPRRNSKMFSKP